VQVTVDLLAGDPSVQDVHVEIEGSGPAVSADAELLKTVFLNLLLNAAHAMQGRGTIRVTMTAVGEGCRVAFADSGPGIPPEVLEKVFTPFFTTKSRGTGLGLPTAKRIIEAHRGTIEIACPPGGGTTVHIDLPAQIR